MVGSPTGAELGEVAAWLSGLTPAGTTASRVHFWEVFRSWATENNHVFLPASHVTVALFLKYGLEVRDWSASTLAKSVPGAIAYFHKINGFENPCAAGFVPEAIKRVQAQATPKDRAKDPLPLDLLISVARLWVSEGKQALSDSLGEASLVKTLDNFWTLTRDVLMMFIGWGAANRGAEITSLRWCDVALETHPDSPGSTCLHVRSLKTKNSLPEHKQVRHSAYIGCGDFGENFDLGEAYFAYLQLSSSRLGVPMFDLTSSTTPMFVKTAARGRGEVLSSRTPSHRLKAILGRIGLSPAEVSRFASHSLRKGFATAAFNTPGVQPAAIAAIGGWRSLTTLLRVYCKPSASTLLSVGEAIRSHGLLPVQSGPARP